MPKVRDKDFFMIQTFCILAKLKIGNFLDLHMSPQPFPNNV